MHANMHRSGTDNQQTPPPSDPLRIVCIADTHNAQPSLPAGDVLIHAGDLTDSGSFDEMQVGLEWLASQPHRYKILVAGNHDVLLDEGFLQKYPERRYGQSKTKKDLNWADIIYLDDALATLEFRQPQDHANRTLTVFGSPWTPRYGLSAFQYHPDDGRDHWDARLSRFYGNGSLDILVTHGPPKHHLDARDFHRAGCPDLGTSVAQIHPKLMIFGHIHAAHGREAVALDPMQRAYEEVMTGTAGYVTGIGWMVLLLVWDWVDALLWRILRVSRPKTPVTVFVNAAVVGGSKNELRNEVTTVIL